MAMLRRYLSGLAVAILGLCAAGWLALAPAAFGYRGSSLNRAELTDRATAAGLAAASLVTLVCSVVAWRRRLRADGVLSPRKTRAARRRSREVGAEPAPDPARVLSDLRVLLCSVMTEEANGAPDGHGPAAVTIPAPRNEPGPEADPVAEMDPDYYGSVVVPGDYRPERAPRQVRPYQPQPRPAPDPVPEPGGCQAGQAGLAAMESMLAGAELLMVGCGEEEAW